MSDSPTASQLDNPRKIRDKSSHYSQHLHETLDGTTQSQYNPSINKMRLGKSDSNSSPIPSGELPPLVGVPHVSNHSVTSDSTLLPSVCHGAVENDTITAQNTASPLMRRRLKYMVRQCSDSELLKINSGLGTLKMAPASATVPHPPDQSPRSQNSSETNSPRILRNPQKFNPSRTGLGRVSRSLEASPMVVRRTVRRRDSGDRDSTSSPVPPSPTPCSDQKRRPRPFSFGSYTDVLQYVGSNTEPVNGPPSMPGSPFIARRSGSLRGGVILPPSRPDTPANDALSLNGSRKSNQMPTSSGERNDFDDDEVSLALDIQPDENAFPRRRLRRDSGSQNAQRNSNASLSSADCYRNIPRKSQHMIGQSGANDNQCTPSYQHEEHELGHVGDDDIGYPSDLYDIQERRESILSIEAVQEIARRFASTNNDANDSNTGTEEMQEAPKQEEKKRFKKDTIPEYRKQPLSTERRVSNWLKGIPDPTEGVPTSHTERLLPDII